MMTNGWIGRAALAGLAVLVLTAAPEALAQEAVVYDVYRPVDLGGESPPKMDYFITLGAKRGVREGSIVKVLRRVPTYDQLGKKLMKDVTFPIATLKVIHAEADSAIARLDKFLPEDDTPAISPRAIMVGDPVEASR